MVDTSTSVAMGDREVDEVKYFFFLRYFIQCFGE